MAGPSVVFPLAEIAPVTARPVAVIASLALADEIAPTPIFIVLAASLVQIHDSIAPPAELVRDISL